MISVAIDGPSGAGKSTLAKFAAKELGYVYVDTGAIYRAVGLYAVRNKANTKSNDEVSKLLKDIKIELKYIDGVQKILLNGEDVSDEIRMPEISMAASNVSAIPKVREFLLDLQRNMAKTHNVIMDGRDIATVVLPNAQVKIFLTATPEKRAQRRFKELCDKNITTSFDNVLNDIIQRDYNDSHRASAPLKQADDAILLDTTEIDLEKSLKKILEIIKEKIE